jgi:large subunit ribosomal protein L25
MQSIQFEIRDAKTANTTLRKAGKIPAVFYGPKEKSTPISIKETEFKKVWKEAGESSIIVLKHGTEEHEALIQDVDIHPVSGVAQHADFYVIEKGKKLEVSVPLEFVGVSPAVKDLGGILVKVIHEMEIEALPKDLPKEINVDISALTGLDSQILARDIKLPAGVELKINPEDVIAAIAVAKEEIEEPTKSIEDIEVVGAKGKEEVEGEGEAGEAKAPEVKKAPEKK